ncbi:hypothetical protein MA16_Dca015870 [Dendrobium catenatum]|uniref:Reverse transcriptase zinc-binding domain-containing protein n=1 Tax=Dendrobium catenatum TaxID=906689 RepID=A0A2I0VMG9_9ASPA|nr:hypothetical protein MA16_Dca015870 [Dendrobium catenatum]
MSGCDWHKMVWHKRHSIKHSVFTWLALMGGLKTANALQMRNIPAPKTCSLCNAQDETVAHLYFECCYSFNILCALIPGMHRFLLRPNILQVFEWLTVAFKDTPALLNFYLLICGCVIYSIWKEKNSRHFWNSIMSHTSLLLSIKRIIFEKVMRWGNSMELLDRL